MRTRIADYQIIRPLGDDQGEGSAGATDQAGEGGRDRQSDRQAAAFLAHPPARLGLGDALVVVRPLSSSGVVQYGPWVQRLSAARSPYLPQLLERGTDPEAGPQAAFWSHSWTGDATLASPPFSLSLAFVLWLVVGAARGAHALHQVGVVHGDIHAAAIRFDDRTVTLDLPITPADATPGLVRRIHRSEDLDLVEPGVARGELPSRASEVWTLGAVLHQALTGQLLHPGLAEDPPVTAVQRIMFEPATIAPGIDAEAARIIGRCLAPDPDKRPRTAGDLADELETLGRQR